MGISNSNAYSDGDIPRETLDIFSRSGGWVYYKSCDEGLCSRCNDVTNYWFITIKSKGEFLCNDCRKSPNDVSHDSNTLPDFTSLEFGSDS